jgi:hypothetical protein
MSRSTNWRAVIGREVKAVGFVTLYFFCCFGIILTLKKLFLADYHIESYALSATVVSAVIAAKIVVTLDHTRAGTRFDASRALVTAVSYKTVVYGAVAFGALFAERPFHAYRASGGLGVAIAQLWEPEPERDPRQGDLCRPDLCGISPLHRDRSPAGRGHAPAACWAAGPTRRLTLVRRSGLRRAGPS